MKDVLDILNRIGRRFFPLLNMVKANGKCKEKTKDVLEAQSEEIPEKCSKYFASWSAVVDCDDAKELYEQSLVHKESIEEKAKPLVAIAGFLATLFVGLSGTAIQLFEMLPASCLRPIVALIEIYAVFRMVAAALAAITIFTTIIEMYLFVPPVANKVYEYKKLAMLNELTNIIRGNYLATSFECLKRSLIALLLLFSITVIMA